MMRPTCLPKKAATAIAVARYVLPVPAGPMPNVIVFLRMASTYSFWFTVRGPTWRPRCVQTMSPYTSEGLPDEFTAMSISDSTMPGLSGRPPRMTVRSSSIAARAFSTASVSPSRMSTLPRSVSVQSRRCSRILRWASCSPARLSAMLLLSRSMTVRDTGVTFSPPDGRGRGR